MKVVGIVGSSGSGKTTLIRELVPLLRARNLRVSTIKHAHHGFDIDKPGKDSYLHRQAGAEEVLVVSQGRWALLHEDPHDDDLSLPALLRRMSPVDLVLVEGFKGMDIPKIEVHRSCTGARPLFPEDPNIVAVASDDASGIIDRAHFSLAAPAAISEFIVALPHACAI